MPGSNDRLQEFEALMPLCPHCVHLNPVGVERCKKCGAWLSTDPEPAAGSPPPVAAESTSVADEPVDVEPLSESPEESLERQVRGLAARGQKIEAIRLYRERTGADLKRAKDYVEGFSQGTAIVGDRVDERILSLLRTGQKILAIKEYRERTGVGLKEAKEYVEAVGRRHGVGPPSAGCGATAVLLLLAASGLILCIARM
jgi:ribosomal protein L7/L12